MRRWLLLLAAAASLFGCRHSPRIERTLSLPAALEISAVTVDPVSFRWDEGSFRSLELAQRMVDEGLRLQGDTLLFFGTWEAVPFGEPVPKSRQSPIVAQLIPYGVPPERLVIIRPWVEQRVQSGATAVQDSAGKNAGKARSEELTFIGHVDVVSGGNYDTVAELSGEVQVDPFAEREDDSDSAPELTRLMETLMAEALSVLRPQLRMPAAPPKPFQGALLFAPQQTFPFVAAPDKPSLQMQLLKGDALDQEVARRGRIAFANPGIDDDTAAKLAATKGGLYVRSADPDIGLFAGDLVLQIDRRPALRQAFHRALLSPAPTELLVKRATGEETVVVIK